MRLMDNSGTCRLLSVSFFVYLKGENENEYF